MLNGAYASQQIVDEALQVNCVLALIDVEGSVLVRGGIGLVDRGVEVDGRRGVEIANAPPLIDVSLIAEVDAPFKGMWAALVGHVVH